MSAAPGNLFILAAPSGAGKSSLLKALLSEDQQSDYPMQVSISHTTRSPRPNEVDGEHYHFVTRETFEKFIAEGIFFEWAEVFGNYYGTSRPVIEQTLNQGVDVFLDIDWQGARQVKRQNEISHYQEFDYIVVNDDFDQALADLSTIVASQRLVQRLQSERHKTLFASMQD
jgi:guanylate kinase